MNYVFKYGLLFVSFQMSTEDFCFVFDSKLFVEVMCTEHFQSDVLLTLIPIEIWKFIQFLIMKKRQKKSIKISETSSFKFWYDFFFQMNNKNFKKSG